MSGWPLQKLHFQFQQAAMRVDHQRVCVFLDLNASGVSVSTLTGICSITRSLRRLLASEGGTRFSVKSAASLHVFGSDSRNAHCGSRRHLSCGSVAGAAHWARSV